MQITRLETDKHGTNDNLEIVLTFTGLDQATPFATYLFNTKTQEYFIGKYFKTFEAAKENFFNRIAQNLS